VRLKLQKSKQIESELQAKIESGLGDFYVWNQVVAQAPCFPAVSDLIIVGKYVQRA
jgi:hypothetical protein